MRPRKPFLSACSHWLSGRATPFLSAFAHQGVRGGGLRVRGGAGARGGGGRDALGARVPAEARQVLLADRKTQVMLIQRKKTLVHSPNANSEKRSQTQIKGSAFGFLEDGHKLNYNPHLTNRKK